MISSGRREPLYQQIYAYLLTEIKSGALKPGARVPSEKELSNKFEVSRITSKRALEILSSEGRIVRVPGKGSFVPETLAPVREAGGERRQIANLLGCVMADFDDSFGVRMLEGIERRAAELGYQIVLHLSRDIAGEEEAVAKLQEIGALGVIMMPCHGEHYNSTILKLVLDKFPLVFVDRNLRGLAASSVATDNVGAAKLGTDHLIDLGHRVIGFVSAPVAYTSTIEDRYEGFVKSHAEHGVAIDEDLRLELLKNVRPPHYWTLTQVASDVDAVCNHLTSHPKMSAIFASEFAVAKIVEIAARRIGVRIPEDLSLVCFDHPMRYDLQAQFTYLRQRQFEIGTRATQLVHDQISGAPSVQKIRLKADLVIGPTSVPPASGAREPS